MMRENSPFLILDLSCNDAVDWISHQVNQAGLFVLRTFDLQTAKRDQSVCPCPHHATEPCDCQMVVLLVYPVNRQPVTIIAHGYNGQTWFSMVDTPEQRADPQLEASILRLVASPPISLTNVKNLADSI